MSEALFTPIKVGDATLQHRVVLCPLTRNRANDQHVHTDLATEYYSQRASEPGTLLITEATFIAPQAGGYPNVPGCYNDEQIAAWKKIVDAVHAKGSFIYLQLWALGRTASAETLKAEGGYDLVSASNIPMSSEGEIKDSDRPRALTTSEVKEYVGLYAQAAKNFVLGAGGDGVEIHGANGYLVDQFTQTNSNVRTDQYGGSVENRSRFCLEVVAAVSAAVGQEKTGLRISPFSHFQGMRMSESDLFETFTYLAKELKRQYPKMAYLHAVTPRIAGNTDIECPENESLDFLHKIWSEQPLILAGSYKPETAKKEAAQHKNVLIGFGRDFISNPDLPRRIREGIELTKYDRDTFYLQGQHPEGYIDYPFAK